jgi:outer membrane usher protein
MPISPIRSLTSTASWRDDERGSRVEYRRGRGSTDLGPSYRLATEFGDDPRVLDASLRYDAAVASGQLDVARFDGDNRARANLTGSLANVDGEFGLTRRLGRAFGVVDLPGYPDVTVYLENREVGRTDADGSLFLPRLNPYQANRIRVRAEDLPLTAELKSEELIAVPFDRSGVRLAFAIKDQRTALATLLDGVGEPLPAGLELASADGQVVAQVADRGLAYVQGSLGEAGAGEEAVGGAGGPDMAGGPLELVSVPGQPPFRCPLPPLPAEPMAQLGEITCR